MSGPVKRSKSIFVIYQFHWIEDGLMSGPVTRSKMISVIDQLHSTNEWTCDKMKDDYYYFSVAYHFYYMPSL